MPSFNSAYNPVSTPPHRLNTLNPFSDELLFLSDSRECPIYAALQSL